MSWTVQEDGYKTSALGNVAQTPGASHETLAAETPGRKPPGKYTQSSQVFSLTSTAAHPDSGLPLKDATEARPSNWSGTLSPAMAAPTSLYPVAGTRQFVAAQRGFSRRPQPTNATERGISLSPSYYTGSARHSLPLHNGGGSGLAVGRAESAEVRQTANFLPFGERDMASIETAKWGGATARVASSHQLSPVSLTAEGLRGHVYETAKDQHGCRHLQRWLDTNNDPETLQVIMSEIVPHVAELMTDQYANFLVQKLFDVMPDDVRYRVACAAAPEIVAIALTPHGTFSVQKMIETISTRDEMLVVREALAYDVVHLVKDAHGNHVIQKVLQRFDYADKQFIYDAVMTDCTAIAKNKQGCCVLQRCLEHASAMQRSILVKHILSCCLDIVQDPFGNYVIQYVLESREPSVNDTVAVMFLPHLVHLCMNKFSSNVMEKVLRGASVSIQEMYVQTLCDQDIASCLIQDDYGNYVLQTALSITTSRWAERLVSVLRPLMPLVKHAPYAKKLEGKMEALARRNACDGGGGIAGMTYRGDYNAMPRMDYANRKNSRGVPSNHHRRFHEARPSTWQPS